MTDTLGGEFHIEHATGGSLFLSYLDKTAASSCVQDILYADNLTWIAETRKETKVLTVGRSTSTETQGPGTRENGILFLPWEQSVQTAKVEREVKEWDWEGMVQCTRCWDGRYFEATVTRWPSSQAIAWIVAFSNRNFTWLLLNRWAADQLCLPQFIPNCTGNDRQNLENL